MNLNPLALLALIADLYQQLHETQGKLAEAEKKIAELEA